MNKINIITLGCAKNTVDSEHLAAQLAASGIGAVHDGEAGAARTAVVNTCGFIGDAKEESVNTILQLADAKQKGLLDRLYVFGCLSERHGAELREEIPEADGFFGVNDMPELVAAVGGRWDAAAATSRELSTPRHYAYLKISEGCDRTCSFCIIPQIRGKHRSVPVEELLAEARLLAAKGVKELIVIAQDTTWYGLDLYGERRLASLLEELCRVEGIEWIRLHYAYPAGFPDEVIELMARREKICKYIDIPLQHIADPVLRSMRRASTGADIRALTERLRERVPGIAIRTTMIVGYPGETEGDFEELLDFIRVARFERLGVFPYSEEEGTRSARTLKDDVPQTVKEARAERLMAVQGEIALESNLSLVGSCQRVIIDSREGDYWVCRTQWDSPEVDQNVFIPFDARFRPGDFCEVNIEKGDYYELFGKLSAT